jgi:hypothetical protein
MTDFERRLRSNLPRLADEVAREPLDASGADRGATDTPVADVVDERAIARRRMPAVGLAVAIAVIVAALAIPLSLQARDHGTRRTEDTKTPHRPKVVVDGPGHYEKIVAAAVGKTVATGSYRVQFNLTEHAGQQSQHCERAEFPPLEGFRSDAAIQPPATECFQAVHDVTTTGVAIVNTSPFAMHVDSNVSNFGDVTVVAGPNAVWEFGGVNYGSDGNNAGPGQPLAGFASLVESTLGPREGALGMTGLASPNGYLNLTSNAITKAQPIGDGTVDGVAVKMYRVTVDLRELATADAITPDGATAINDALAVLHKEGYTGTTEAVSVDADGFIRRTTSTATFDDGGTVVSDNTFSQFGCAGIVGLPGSGAPAVTPQACPPPTPSTTATTATSATAATTTAP